MKQWSNSELWDYIGKVHKYFLHFTLSPHLNFQILKEACFAGPCAKWKHTSIIQSFDLLWGECLLKETCKSNLSLETCGWAPYGVLHASGEALHLGIEGCRGAQRESKVVWNLIDERRQKTPVHHTTRKQSSLVTWLAVRSGTTGGAMPLYHWTDSTKSKWLKEK